MQLRVDDGRLLGRSDPLESGSRLTLDLGVDGNLVTGSWSERTSPTGHYRAATYHGVVQMILDPTGRAMTGRWLGISKRYTIKSGEWRLDRLPDSTTGPVTSATTTAPGVISPVEIMAKSPNSILPT